MGAVAPVDLVSDIHPKTQRAHEAAQNYLTPSEAQSLAEVVPWKGQTASS